MNRLLLALLTAIPLLAQNSSPDSQLIQALLAEIRQLRQDLQTTAVTIQRVQIVMYRLQAQTAAVNRAMQRLDDARRNCNQAQSQRKMFEGEIARNEERLRNTQNPVDRKNAEDALPRLKSNVEMFTAQEMQCHSAEADADSQSRAERAKMSELEDQLEKLDKILAAVGSSAGATVPGRRP